MTIALVAQGATTFGFNTPITPVIPSGASAGQLMLMTASAHQGSPTPPTISGWTKISTNTNASAIALYGRYYVAADVGPSFTYGTDFASAWIDVYSGCYASLSGIVHFYADALSNNISNIIYPAATITVNGCLLLWIGSRDKTTTTNGASFTTLSGFTIRNSLVIKDNAMASVTNEQIQTTAANIAAMTQFLSISESATQQYESMAIALLPATSATYSLAAGSGSFATTGESAIFTPGFASNTLLAAPGAFDLVGAPASSDMQIYANPGMLSMAGEAASLASGGFPPVQRDPNQFTGHWHHLRKKEVAKLKRIELALRKNRGEIHEELAMVEAEPARPPLPVIRANATGLAEHKVDLSSLLAAIPMSPKVPVDRLSETAGQRQLREYEEMTKRLMTMIPSMKKRH